MILARLRALAFMAALTGTSFVSTRADATVVIRLSDEQLVDRSDLIVRATVISQQSEWNEDRSQIITLTRLGVMSYLKGSGTGDLVLRQFGGEIDGLRSSIEGDANLESGQDVVLFLRRGNGVVFLTAMAQAAFYVQWPSAGAGAVNRDMEGLTFAMPRNGSTALVAAGDEPDRPLEPFLTRIQSLARSGR